MTETGWPPLLSSSLVIYRASVSDKTLIKSSTKYLQLVKALTGKFGLLVFSKKDIFVLSDFKNSTKMCFYLNFIIL